MPRYFLTALGIGSYEETTYRLGDARWTSRFAPTATARLTRIGDGRALILATPPVRDSAAFARMSTELTESGLVAQAVDTAETRDSSALLDLINRLAERIPQGSELTLDVTYGLRHLPFVYQAVVLFLTGLKQARVKGIYYGARELRISGGDVPLIDLTPTLGLIEWFGALRALREYGDAREMARLFSGEVAGLFKAKAGDAALGRVRDGAVALGRNLAAGLPLEAGLAAGRLRRAVAGAGRDAIGLSAMRRIADTIAPIALKPGTDKEEIGLDQNELARELRLARWYTDRLDLGKALAVLREWLVNAAILALGKQSRWLERDCRQAAEGLLHAAHERKLAGLASPQEAAFGTLWNSVADQRNAIAHAGMRPVEVKPSQQQVEAAIAGCERLLLDELPANLGRITPRGPLLITALGLSPGVLYSVVLAFDPEAAVIITSADARGRIFEALGLAGRPDLHAMVREVADPHRGFDEGARLIDAEIVTALGSAAQVVVNLTGGTTVMQWLVESMAERAARLGTAVRRIALVDRRSPEEQRTRPYVRGEVVELEPVEPSDTE